LFNVDFDTQIVSVDMFVCIGHVLYGDEYTKYDRWQPVSTAARQQRDKRIAYLKEENRASQEESAEAGNRENCAHG
jgi:hypothetical protein